MPRKPTVLTKCIANLHTSSNERIIEVSDRETDVGCLISIRRRDDGTLIIEPYRADPGKVIVRVSGIDTAVPN